ncbi:MAG: sialate O-acetylesterase [Opitutales bacterium]|nr:sialate O-acetylesterase [Opitutales bacterium]
MIRRIFSSVFVFAVVTGALVAQSVSIPEDRENFHVFLLMGQSNMEGHPSTDGAMDKTPHPRVLKLNAWNSWEVAVDPITNNYTEAVGPGLAFAKKLAGLKEDVSVGLVPVAYGGTNITQWSKGSDLYNLTLQLAAVAANEGVIKGVLWHQGEHDAIFPWDAGAYADRLFKLIDDLRTDLRVSELPFIVGGLTHSPEHLEEDSGNLSSYVWRRLHRVGTTGFKTGYVRSAGVPYIEDDDLHFSSDGQRMMGERYCDEFLRVDGFWQEQTKALLDEEAILDEETGWKWHPSIGIYYDVNFPYIKHKQLGWLILDAYADGSLLFSSPINGEFRTLLNDGDDNGLYIYRQNENPEIIAPGDTYFVNLVAEPGSEIAIYDHQLAEWSETLLEAPKFESADDFYYNSEKHFIDVQIAVDRLKNGKLYGLNWMEMTESLKNAEKSRIYTILYAQESFKAALEMEESPLKDFWLEKTMEIIDRIDAIFIQGQDAWAQYTADLFS